MPTETIEASADAWIDEDEPTANHGTGLTLLVRSEGAANRRAPVQFDMDQLPADFLEFTAEDAHVEVTVDQPDDVEDRTIALWWYDAAFDEASITWDAQPGDEFDGAIGSDLAQAPDQVLRFDMLGLLEAIPTSGDWPLNVRDGDEGGGLLGPFEVTLYSRETSNPPVFVFTYRAKSQADLTSHVTPRLPGEADLDGQVLPRLASSAHLDAAVEPLFSQTLAGVVEVRAVEIDDGHEARATGRVTIELDGALDDVRDILDEVGVKLDVDGETHRAVVQLLDDAAHLTTARPNPGVELSRGDAVLFALGDGSVFAPGTTIEWLGSDWRVTGTLDAERVTDEVLFREVGLERLATVDEARATGTVQREGRVDLYSEVGVP